MKETLKTWRQRGMEMREMRREAKSPNRSHCQNCGTKLEGAYCYLCGQAAKEPRRAVIGLVQDVFVETLAIDGKLFRTIALLLRAPGKLARRYLEGQRVRYSPPFRLYLFASVFFFLAFWQLNDFVTFNPDGGTEMQEETLLPAEGERPAEEPAEGEGPSITRKEILNTDEDGVNFSVTEGEWETDIEWLKPYVAQMEKAANRVKDDPRLFMAQLRENLPRFMLLAPVVYALTLLLLYFYRRKFFVYDHFVVSLYMHAALYAYLLFMILFSRIPVIGGLWWILLIWAAVQPILVQRQAYGSNWFSTIFKWLVANAIYWIAMMFIIMAGLGYSLLQS